MSLFAARRIDGIRILIIRSLTLPQLSARSFFPPVRPRGESGKLVWKVTIHDCGRITGVTSSVGILYLI